MAQHFLLSAQARTLTLAAVARLSEDEARAIFRQIRWATTDGDPVCPRCGCTAVYAYASRPIFKGDVPAVVENVREALLALSR